MNPPRVVTIIISPSPVCCVANMTSSPPPREIVVLVGVEAEPLSRYEYHSRIFVVIVIFYRQNLVALFELDCLKDVFVLYILAPRRLFDRALLSEEQQLALGNLVPLAREQLYGVFVCGRALDELIELVAR